MRELDEFSWLPGVLTWDVMTRQQWHGLSRFHYIAGDPPMNSRYFGVWHTHNRRCTAVALLVLSYPPVASFLRDRALELSAMHWLDRLRWVNANVKTISRVIVHPQFRGVGLAPTMVRQLLHEVHAPLVETFSRMERALPFFTRAGMSRVDPDELDKPVYLYFRDPNTLGERGGGGRELTVPSDKPPFPSRSVFRRDG